MLDRIKWQKKLALLSTPSARSKNNELEKDSLWKNKRVIRKCWALIAIFQ